MSWEREPLWSKSKLFFEKAFNEDMEEPYFGLWCALGLELLCRSAVAKFSPALLAEQDRQQQNLLYSLGLATGGSQNKSIGISQVLFLCKTLITEFVDEDVTAASAIINRRNEELHSGSAAFLEYPTEMWIGGFYKCCKILAESQHESLISLFGERIANQAEHVIEELKAQVISKTKQLISAHCEVFNRKSIEEKKKLEEDALRTSEILAYRGHHRVVCPSCGCSATVYGEPSGKDMVESNDGEIIVRQSILPARFNCNACELKLNGFGALSAAGVSAYYTRRTKYTPEEYYDMINPEDYDSIESHYREHFRDNEWNNE